MCRMSCVAHLGVHVQSQRRIAHLRALTKGVEMRQNLVLLWNLQGQLVIATLQKCSCSLIHLVIPVRVHAFK